MSEWIVVTEHLVGLLRSQLRLAELIQSELQHLELVSADERDENDPTFVSASFARLLQRYQAGWDLIEELAERIGQSELMQIPLKVAPNASWPHWNEGSAKVQEISTR